MQIDAQNMLGNVDPNKRFQRDPLAITGLEGNYISFQIGTNRFKGQFLGNTLHLRRENNLNSETLKRTNDMIPTPPIALRAAL